MNLYDYKFFESVGNLKVALKAALDRDVNTGTASDIATCLQQGRQFFEAAEAAPLEIRPLLVQYGVIAMGKALTASRTARPMNTFVASHGLRDTSPFDARLSDLTLAVDDRGSFQEFNDAVRTLDSCAYFGKQNEPLRVFMEWSEASRLTGKTVTFDDLFSRLPTLAPLYTKTFAREPNWLNARLYVDNDGMANIEVRIKGHSGLDRDVLKATVNLLRRQNSFLNQWTVREAQCSWGDLTILFANIDAVTTEERDVDALHPTYHGAIWRFEHEPVLTEWYNSPPPICGSLIHPHVGVADGCIHPLHGTTLSWYSILYMATFMLGSMVRYRPQTWVHAITGRVTQERATDDQAIYLVETFLSEVLEFFPALTINAITTRRENVTSNT